MCTGPKVLVTPQQPRSRCAARDVSGDHVLNKRESRPERRSHSVPLSYRMERGPGDQGRFYSREAESRVSLHLWSPSCCVQLRVHTSQWRRDVEGGPRPCHGARDEVAGGATREGKVAGVEKWRRRRRRRWREGERFATRTSREEGRGGERGRVIMLLASTVPRWREGEMDEARKREAGVKYLVPSPSFHHSSLPLHPLLVVPRSGLFLSLPRHPISTSSSLLSTEIKRVEAGKKKRIVRRREERGCIGRREGRRGRLGKRVPACTTRYTHLQQF